MDSSSATNSHQLKMPKGLSSLNLRYFCCAKKSYFPAIDL
jgi:hypothetical protein